MNLEKVVFGFFIVLAATLNFGFFIGDIVGPAHHEVWTVWLVIRPPDRRNADVCGVVRCCLGARV